MTCNLGINRKSVTYFSENFFPTVEVSSMSISQSIECPLTTRDTVTMSGTLSSQNGNGSGNFVVSGRRLINKGWFEVDVGAGNGPVIGLKGSRNLSQKVFCNAGMTTSFRNNVIIPILTGSMLNICAMGHIFWFLLFSRH